MNKKLLIAGAFGTGILAVGALIPVAVFAQTANTSTSVSTFVQQLAAKLGLDQTTVQNAVTSVQTDMQATRDAETATQITQAVTDGKLTQRQADILNGLISVRETLKSDEASETRPNFTGLTQDQIKAQLEAERTQDEQQAVDALNAKGLNTTLTELQSTQQAARDAGIRGEFGGRGGMGFRMGRM